MTAVDAGSVAPRQSEDILLEARGLTKSYGTVEALRGADLTLRRGEVHALLGDNGAGKSTLVKMLAGVETPDSGTLQFSGREVRFGSSVDAQRQGIEVVYQDLALAPTLEASANVFMGRELLRPGPLGRLGFVDRKRMRAETAHHLARLGIELPSEGAEIGSSSGGQRQAVAIARAVAWSSSLIILDEPTAALGVRQTRFVLDLIRRIREEGNLTVLLISHSMPDVFAVSDRATVLRLGRTVLTEEISSLSTEDVIAAMAGASAVPGQIGES